MSAPQCIALVGPLPPPSGGMANQTRQLAYLLQQEGITVTLVQVNAPYRPAWIARIRGLRALFRLPPYLSALWRAAGQVQLMHIMANSGWSWHLFTAPAVWIGRLRHTPVVINYRGGEAQAFLERAFTWIKPTLKRAGLIVVPSAFLQQVFSRYQIATEIVPNIIDLERFTPAVQRLPPDAPHLVVTRNLEPIYDIPTALRAFALLRQRFAAARLTVAGSGPLRAPLETLTAELGLTDAVTFTGRLDNEKIATLYQSADLLLNASLADNMPISILEALACGVPVVSTRVGGIPFLVQDGETALLVPTGDPEALAQAAFRVLEDPRLAQALRSAGLALARQYAWPRVRERWLAVYQRLLH